VLKEFREFAFKGNLLEIAVGLILALFFAEVITALMNGVILALIAGLFGEPNFDAIRWTVGDATLEIGRFITALVNFVIVAWILFLIVKAVNRLRRSEPESDAPPEEIVLLREIRDQLARR
jgi:large conductance mechanosensitive channel